MRASEWVADLIACFAVLGVAWATGVGWAAYRAVGWVDRIRAWAANPPVEHVAGVGSNERISCLATASIDERGTE